MRAGTLVGDDIEERPVRTQMNSNALTVLERAARHQQRFDASFEKYFAELADSLDVPPLSRFAPGAWNCWPRCRCAAESGCASLWSTRRPAW
ncbi:hypothetical protein AB0G54_24440 [Streptomyces yokosukanensis]|uniref:hypothetical protein n=1 Tax=Streptomyces yokosukanensis TaxID=67386 RepID=UPI003133C893